MKRTLKRIVLGLLFLAMVAALTGCRSAATMAVADEPPAIETEPSIGDGETMLERYSRIHKVLQAEKSRAEKLAGELDQKRKSLTTAVAQLDKLQKEVVELRRRAAERDAALKRYDETQQTLLRMNDEMRTVRRDLLEEKLGRVRAEQALVAAKIEMARGRQRRAEARRREQLARPEESGNVTGKAGKIEKSEKTAETGTGGKGQ